MKSCCLRHITSLLSFHCFRLQIGNTYTLNEEEQTQFGKILYYISTYTMKGAT